MLRYNFLSIFILLLFQGILYGQEKPSLHIISIGVNQETAKYPESDAAALPKILQNHIQASRYEFKTVNVNVMHSTTKDAIQHYFNTVKGTISEEDVFVLYFSGMSSILKDSSSEIEFFISNSEDVDPKTFSSSDLIAWINLIPANKQLIILEAGNNEPLIELIEHYLLNQDPVESILSQRNRVFLTSNGYGQENEKTQSGMMLYLLNNFKTLHQIPNKLIAQKNGVSVFNLFEKNSRSEVTFEFDRALATSDIISIYKPYQRIYFEDEIRAYLTRIKNRIVKQDTTIQLRGSSGISIRKVDKGLPQYSKYAMIIGVDDYEADEWSDLVNPVFDAKTVHEILSNDYGFQSTLLINPGKEEILTQLLSYKEIIKDSTSQFLFFFAGHGDYEKPFEGTLVTSTTKSKNTDLLRSSYITHANLRNYLNYVPAKHVLVILDACFGGTFDQALGQSDSRSGNMEIYDDASKSSFIKRKMKYQTRRYITSGGKEYVPDGRQGFHSPFARKLVQALLENSSDRGILTINKLNSYLEKVTPEPRSGEFGSNEPGSDFIFIGN